MPRCKKIVRGKRCKAYCIAGSKYCLFHTPGQGMRRSKQKKNVEMDDPEISRANRMARRTVENQVIGRGSRKLANTVTAYGAYLQTRPDSYLYTRENPARYHKSGTRYVGATTSRMTIHYRSDGGRNFRATDGSKKARLAMGRKIVWGGRLIPVLGYGYIAYNMYQDPIGTTEDMAGPGIATSTDSMAYRVSRDSWEFLLEMMQTSSRTNSSPAARGYQTRGGVL